MTDILKKGEIWRQTCTRGECHVKMKVETGMMLLQAKERQGCQANTRSWGGGKSRCSLAALSRTQTCPYLDLRPLVSRTVRQCVSVAEAARFVALCHSSLRILIQQIDNGIHKIK